LDLARILLLRSDLEIRQKKYKSAVKFLKVLLTLFPNNQEAQSKLDTITRETSAFEKRKIEENERFSALDRELDEILEKEVREMIETSLHKILPGILLIADQLNSVSRDIIHERTEDIVLLTKEPIKKVMKEIIQEIADKASQGETRRRA
jgi:phosphoenolpyruvate carboxylase